MVSAGPERLWLQIPGIELELTGDTLELSHRGDRVALGRQDLDGDRPVEAGVGGLVGLAHAVGLLAI